jgi:7-cyano-7-deazaguanine synthase
MSKSEITRKGIAFRLDLTLSCIRPSGGLHCGRCNKCEERRKAFEAAGLIDPTRYLS